jgi:acyl dehydratase
MIGAPLYLTTLKCSDAGPMPAQISAESKGAFAGLGAYYGGSRWDLREPIRPGDRLVADERLIEVSEQDSARYGRTVIRADTKATYRRRSDGACVAEHTWWFFHVERSARGRNDSEGKVAQSPNYTPEQIEEVEQQILGERPRGAEPRYADSVAVDDPLPELIKGPMRVSDVLAWRIGNGPGSTQWGAFRMMSLTRQRIPAFFTRNPVGAWDIVQRLHWESEWAAQVGQPRPFDEGPMREAWLAHVVTDWMGDHGRLESLQTRLGGFNYVGDMTRLGGHVIAVHPNGQVEVEVNGINQDGVTTCSAVATVRLPRREQAR